MTRLIEKYGSIVRLWYYSGKICPEWDASVYNRLLARICKEHGSLEFLIFLYEFVRLHGILPIVRDNVGNNPDFVAEVLAETSVDITDKAAILDLENLIR